MAMSAYLQEKLANHSLGVSSYTMPVTVYLALYSTDPTENDTGAELTDVDRVAVAFDAWAAHVSDNTSDETLQKAIGAATETASHWGLRDSDTVGNLLYYGPLMSRRILGDATTQFDITNPEGEVFRYTWDTTGTDPQIAGDDPDAGDMIYLNGANFSAANNGFFRVVASDTNWFEIVNPDGVAEGNKTIGVGSVVRYTATTKSLDSEDKLEFSAGLLDIWTKASI